MLATLGFDIERRWRTEDDMGTGPDDKWTDVGFILLQTLVPNPLSPF